MDGDHGPFAETRPKPSLDLDGQGMGVLHGHLSVHADVHLDGDRGADAARAQVVGLADLGIRRDDSENLLLDILRQRLFEQFRSGPCG